MIKISTIGGEVTQKNRPTTNQKIEARVFDIQRFSVHDGPGIRTVVFLKGCPLRCLWCDNPESQSLSAEIAEFDRKCIGCGSCKDACPEEAIYKSNLRINRVFCTTCGKCAEVCPSGAKKIVGAKRSAESIVEEVEKDRLFYDNSGGGVTLSGGEPLAQPIFSREILRICKERGIHTAMETCGYAPWAKFRELLPFLKLVLYDIKNLDSEKHKKFTNRSNQLILQNFVKLIRLKFPMVLRVPIIPGYTDARANTDSIVKLLKPHRHLRRIDLLPYHKLGVGKYERLGKEYRLARVNPPSEESVRKIKKMLESRGFQVRMGG